MSYKDIVQEIVKNEKIRFEYDFKYFISYGDTGVDTTDSKTIIAETDDQVIEYLKQNYSIEFMDDMSDFDSITYSISAIYDENGIEASGGWDDEKCECKEGFYEQTDTIEAFRSETPLTEKEYNYLKTGQHWKTVVDLTEETD